MKSFILALSLTLASSLTMARAAEPCPDSHIQAHLRAVERELQAADTTHLTEPQRTARAVLVARLAAYRERCEFPQNKRYPDRLVTIFVDERDVHCALGWLMAEDGRSDLVAKIRATRNTATVWELAGDSEAGPDIAAWLERSGLSLYEAARIQPSYCYENFGGSCMCGGRSTPIGTAVGVAEGEITAVRASESQVEAKVTAVHGEGAAVGDSKTIGWVDGDAVGRRVMIVLRADPPNPYRGANPIGESDVQCQTGPGMGPEELPYCARVPSDVYIEALLSEDCLGALAAYDPVLDDSVCTLNGKACPKPGATDTPDTADTGGDDGCQGGASAAAAAVFAAMAFAFGLRRRRI